MFTLQDFANMTKAAGITGDGGMAPAAGAPAYNPDPAPLQQGYGNEPEPYKSADPFSKAIDYNGLAGLMNSGARAINGTPFDLPTADLNSKAPTYSANGFGTANMDPALKATLTAGNQGTMAQGVNAFLGSSWTPYVYSGGGPEGSYSVQQDNSKDLFNLAKSIGYDTTGYGKDSGSVNRLYGDLNTKLGDYYTINGLSSGWDGSKGDPRSAAATMYIKQGDQFVPTNWGSNNYSAPTSSSINRANNLEQLSALSMMMPAFGGVAGMLGSGASGTLSAGSGLGLTNGIASTIGTGATNALVNAATNYALSGGRGGVQSLLGSLGGSALGAAGNSMFGKAGGLGDMFNTANAGSMGSVYNPMQGFNSMLGTSGLNGQLSGISGLFSALGGGGINANTMSQLGGSLAGQYLAQQLDPRLRGLGGQAGSSLASLLYR